MAARGTPLRFAGGFATRPGLCRSYTTTRDTTGGMVVSALLANSSVYCSDPWRDDRALYMTLCALRDRLAGDTRVYNPVDGTELTGRSEVLKQVERLRDRLKEKLPKLDVLFIVGCTNAQAQAAWNAIFNHDFWAAKDEGKQSKKSIDLAEIRSFSQPYWVQVACDVAAEQGGVVKGEYVSGGMVLPKGLGLRFRVVNTNAPSDAEFVWHCENDGDEATEFGQVAWDNQGREVWTSTAYKGNHTMTCRVIKNGSVLAEKTFLVRIGRGPVPAWAARRKYGV